MTATVMTTDNEADQRVARGDGGLHPVNHIVRIVVVRAPGLEVASKSDADGHSHGLTDRDREIGEATLMGMPPPAPPERKSGATSPEPKNIFEALKPTDIVVVGREPASVRKLKEGRRLCEHDDRNRDTVLRVWTDSDTIEYRCDEEFEIVEVKRAGWKIYDAPENPFERSGTPPYRAEQRQGPTGGKPIWSWTSGRLPATANNQQYKMTFKIKGELIDPDVVCGDPPPLP